MFCNGVSTIPKRPKLPGLDEFKGVVRHSGDYGSGLDWTGKRALVLGTGTSGHDVAQDLAVSGAHVAMIQNGPTLVVSLKEAQSPYALYDEDIPFEDLRPARHRRPPTRSTSARISRSRRRTPRPTARCWTA